MISLPTKKELLAVLEQHNLISKGEKGLVSVSGGADSLALLQLLSSIQEDLALQLEVVHFDHGLREDSRQDAQWVAEKAEQLGLPFHERKTSHLARLSSGVQAAARQWRLEECRTLMEERGADWTATGHQRDDQLETILLKLLRGCHLSHIRGMEWRQGAFIRPLLGFSHQQLMHYLKTREISWLEDPSNKKACYKRNRIRNELLPLMNELAEGGIGARLETLVEQARKLEMLLESFPRPPQNPPARPPHWMELESLLRLPPLIQEEYLYRFIQERLPGEMDWPHLEKALELLEKGRIHWDLDFPKKRLLGRRGNRLLLSSRRERQTPPVKQKAGTRQIETSSEFTVQPREDPENGREGLWIYNLPESARMVVRNRKPGDRFHPPWREKPVKVKDFLRDQHIPLWERDRLPLLLLEGQVIAIYPKFVAKGHDKPGGSSHPLMLDILRNNNWEIR